VSSQVETGMYILLVGAILLNILNIIVSKGAVASMQDREARLRGLPLEGKAELPSAFFRTCGILCLWHFCCCLRYVAENDDEDDFEDSGGGGGGKDESDGTRLTGMSIRSSGGRTRTRVASLARRWQNNGSRSRTNTAISVYCPEGKGGLPPHWESIVDGKDTYYWNKLTGATTWDVPTRRKQRRVSIMA
jgi:hypothetical protein